MTPDSDREEAWETVARESEAIEAETLAELHRAAPPAVRDAMGLRLETMDGILVSAAARGGNILVNRAIGLGMSTPATAGQIDRIRRIYAEAGIARYFVHASPLARPRPLDAFLEGAGLVRDRGWMKFARTGDPVEEPDTDLDVREIGTDYADSFGRIAGQAFGLAEPAWEALAALVGRPGWHVFMSFGGDTPAGVGALFVRDGLAWTDWGATDPGFRRRGSQSALLARRINAAAGMGCSLICTCTGEAVSGEEQHSYRNILRAGFAEIGLRANYSPAGRPG